jgi:GntR family transcriptional regulator, rspAB operon transcriptional repressor
MSRYWNQDSERGAWHRARSYTSAPVSGGEVLRLPRRRTLGHEPARVQAYAVLREAIVSMQLPPGALLSENELARRLEVSRTPVREALIRLRDERLVRIVPQRGTFVAPISLEAVGDAQFVREALECAAVRLAAERATEDGIASLWANLDAERRAQGADDYEAFYLLDEGLHDSLCDLSGHPIASSLAKRARGHLDRVRRLSLPRSTYLQEMIAEHERVVTAVAEGDPDAAETELRHHLRMVLSELSRLREEKPELFDAEAELP